VPKKAPAPNKKKEVSLEEEKDPKKRLNVEVSCDTFDLIKAVAFFNRITHRELVEGAVHDFITSLEPEVIDQARDAFERHLTSKSN